MGASCTRPPGSATSVDDDSSRRIDDAIGIVADVDRAPLTVLVPSFREERDVVYQTVMAAALQEYSERLVVLLIDDPPNPNSVRAHGQLDAARRLPGEVTGILARAAEPFVQAAESYQRRSSRVGSSRPIR